MATGFQPTPASQFLRQLSTGLAKLGAALKSRAARGEGSAAESMGPVLTPSQTQVLTLLDGQEMPMRLSAIAGALGVTAPTASDMIATLANKGLVAKMRAPDDARAIAVSLTPAGKRTVWKAFHTTDFLDRALTVLSGEERTVFMKGLVKVLYALERRGKIPEARMCITCQHFRPYAHTDAKRPHHCMFYNIAYGDQGLRVECAGFTPAPPAAVKAAWERFSDRLGR